MQELLAKICNDEPLTPTDHLQIQSARPDELDALMQRLGQQLPSPIVQEQTALALAARLRSGQRDWTAAAAAALYDAAPEARGAWLQLLLEDGSEQALSAAAERLVRQPPVSALQVAQGLSPLLRGEADLDAAQRLLSQSWEALSHLRVAAPLLDVANFLCRERRLPHPAAAIRPQLQSLLRELVRRLSALSDTTLDDISAGEAEAGKAMVEQGVPLAVSLCDALALIGDKEAAAPLAQAMEVPHRRIRIEAAGALARLGDDSGRAALLEHAADPVTRLRALHYLQELEMLDEVDPQWLGEESRAEAAVTAWLADPHQFGIPPSGLELVDRRQLFWPGYEDEQECFLFRFTYRFPAGELTNLALAGPVEHAFASDLSALPLPDVYAMFAGWHVEHDEIEDVVPEQLSAAGQVEAERLVRRIHDAGHDDIQPALFCQFFGDKVLVARALREGRPGWAVADAVEVGWLPAAARFGPVEASYVYKGRRLMRVFNEFSGEHPDEFADAEEEPDP